MVETICDRVLYHVTSNKPYKQALVRGQKLSVGAAYNPFFGFYEQSRHYPVTQADGSSIQVMAIAFLKQVRDGRINCPQIAAIAAEVAEHYVMLSRELLMEEIRQRDFPEVPSRQKCLYLCETPQEAQAWNTRIGDGGSICTLRCKGVIHRADTDLLLGDSEPLSVTRDRAHRYWRGEAGENPFWEILFVGDAVVTEVGLND